MYSAYNAQYAICELNGAIKHKRITTVKNKSDIIWRFNGYFACNEVNGDLLVVRLCVQTNSICGFKKPKVCAL